MKANIQKEFKLMASIFKIGVVGFGGGTALIPVIEREVVEDQKIVEKSEYDKDVIVASITPGALPVEIATGLGKRAYGARGMALAAFLMAFPGVLMTVLMLSVLSKVDEQLFVQIECLSIGLTAFISCLLTQYAVKSMQEAKKESTKEVSACICDNDSCIFIIMRKIGLQYTRYKSFADIWSVNSSGSWNSLLWDFLYTLQI